MPWFYIYGKRTFTLAAALIHVPRRVVEHAEHRYDTVRLPVCSFNICTRRTDVMNAQTDTARRLRNQCAVFKGIINSIDAVLLHRQQEARRHLRLRCTCIEQGRRGMGKPFFRK
ncbi:hypothetical protein D3C87_1843070 [compost metagenome]